MLTLFRTYHEQTRHENNDVTTINCKSCGNWDINNLQPGKPALDGKPSFGFGQEANADGRWKSEAENETQKQAPLVR